MGVNEAKGGETTGAMAPEIWVVALFEVSAALADRTSVNVPHHRDEALGFNAVRTLDGRQALFRFGPGVSRRTNLSHFGCCLSVIPITQSYGGVDSRDRVQAAAALSHSPRASLAIRFATSSTARSTSGETELPMSKLFPSMPYTRSREGKRFSARASLMAWAIPRP